jgi:heterodisulfide reductase subunit B
LTRARWVKKVTKRYAFFRGCFIPARVPHIEKVARTIMPELGVELVDLAEFTCCPEPVGFSLHEKMTWLSIAARNISIAEEQGLDIITLCNGCYYTLSHALSDLTDEKMKEKVNEILYETDHEFRGKARVKHFIQVLKEDVGFKKLNQMVTNPLDGLKIASHTGCHFSNIYGPNSSDLDEMVSRLGAESVEYTHKNLCCGWMLGGYGQTEEGYKWLKDKLDNMKGSNADCICVICPQCLHQFDTGQLTVARKLNIPFKIPALFYLQLLGLSMGYNLETVQYSAHRVKEPNFETKIRELCS